MNAKTAVLMGMAVAGGLAGAAHGAELIVPSGSYPSLAIAIAAAADNDTITLLPSGSPYLAVPGFVISGKTITLRGSTGNPNDVVIDGFDVAGNVVLEINGAGASGSIVRDLTVTGGRSPTTGDFSGAGMRIISAGTVTIENCVIRDNVNAANEGNSAGLYATGTTVDIYDTRFENNKILATDGDGGAVYFNGGSHWVENCVFLGNGIDGAFAPDADAYGGGYYADNGATQLVRCRFEGNRGGWGGGVGVSGSATLTVDACEFVDNTARYGAGFYQGSGGAGLVAVIRNSLFDGNSTTVNDVALFTSKGAQVRCCTFVNNTASGSYVIGGTPPAGSVIIDNSIIWGNTMNTHIIPVAMGAIVRNNLLQQAYAGGGGSKSNAVVDPGFVDLAGGDFRLATGSPGIDAGDSNLYMGPFADLDGNLRVLNDPNSPDTGSSIDGPMIDAGCYEFQPEGAVIETCPVDTNGDNTIDLDDLQNLLFNFGTGCP